MVDYFVSNGQGQVQAHGRTATRFLNSGGDWNSLRPWVGEDGRSYVCKPDVRFNPETGEPLFNRNEDGSIKLKVMVTNTEATLRKNEWIAIDSAVRDVSRQRLRLVNDLRSRGLTKTINNPMGRSLFEFQNRSDVTPAEVSFDGIKRTLRDRPHLDLNGIPLPLITKDTSFTMREILISRSQGDGVDVDSIRLMTEQCAIVAEQMLTGAVSYTMGGYSLYGYMTHPDALTKVLTAATAAGWTGSTLVDEILDMIVALKAASHFGKYLVYYAPYWYKYMSRDFSQAKGSNTLMDRIKAIPDIEDVIEADYLTGKTIVVVKMDANTVREVIGFDFVPVQWSEEGGMEQFIKIMGMLLPNLRSDFNGNMGLNLGTAP